MNPMDLIAARLTEQRVDPVDALLVRYAMKAGPVPAHIVEILTRPDVLLRVDRNAPALIATDAGGAQLCRGWLGVDPPARLLGRVLSAYEASGGTDRYVVACWVLCLPRDEVELIAWSMMLEYAARGLLRLGVVDGRVDAELTPAGRQEFERERRELLGGPDRPGEPKDGNHATTASSSTWKNPLEAKRCPQ
jgi:hypothetical protein